MQPNQGPDYDFIMNPQQLSKGPNFAGPQKILMIVLLFGGVIVLLIILFSVISSSGGTNSDNLVRAQANQIELARVIDLGIDDVTDVKLKQQFQTLLTASTTDAEEISSLLAARDVEVLPLELRSALDKSVEETFDEAIQRNNFDPVYEDEVASAAGDYLQALRTAAASAVTTREANLLAVAIENVQTVASPPASE